MCGTSSGFFYLVVLQEEEVKMATVVYLVVAAVGTMFVALSLIGLQSEDRKN